MRRGRRGSASASAPTSATVVRYRQREIAKCRPEGIGARTPVHPGAVEIRGSPTSQEMNGSGPASRALSTDPGGPFDRRSRSGDAAPGAQLARPPRRSTARNPGWSTVLNELSRPAFDPPRNRRGTGRRGHGGRVSGRPRLDPPRNRRGTGRRHGLSCRTVRRESAPRERRGLLAGGGAATRPKARGDREAARRPRGRDATLSG